MRIERALIFVALSLTMAQLARAVAVPIDFQGPEQTVSGSVDLTGELTAVGSGFVRVAPSGTLQPFSTTPPTTHLIKLIGGVPTTFDVGLNSTPGSSTTFDVVAGQLTSINQLDVQLLGGGQQFFYSEPIVITTDSKVALLKAFTVAMSNSLLDLRFQQTAEALLNPTGPGTGTFSIPGLASNTWGGLDVTLADIFIVPLGGGASSQPFLLEGTYTISGPPGNAKIALDGTGGFNGPLRPSSAEFAYALVSPLALTISATVNLPNTVIATFNFHAEQTGVVIPEPASILLLGIGMLAAIGIAGRRRALGHRQTTS